MNQSAFDFNARQSDPWTSHEAARRVREFGASHIDLILDCLRFHGPQTLDELADGTGLTSVQIARRLADCEKQGSAHPTGICRLSASGRMEREWTT